MKKKVKLTQNSATQSNHYSKQVYISLSLKVFLGGHTYFNFLSFCFLFGPYPLNKNSFLTLPGLYI